METINGQKSIQNATLAIALITNFANTFSFSALNIAIPHIGTEFSATAISLSWVVQSYIMVSVLLTIPIGRAADIYGRKLILKYGLLLFGIASLLNIFVMDMSVFILLRVLQGVGTAMVFATNIAILVSVYPGDKRGSVLGIAVASVYAGASCGPVIGGLITHAFGWRAIFIVIFALSLTAFILLMARSPVEIMENPGQRINSSSIAMYIVSFAVLLLGLVTLTQHVWSYICLAAGVLLLLLFIRHETGTEMPVIEVRLFKGNPVYTLSLLAALFNYAAVFTVSYLMSIYLQLARGFGADISGLIMILQPVVQAVLSPIAGRLSDRKSPAVMSSIGMACCAGALFVFSSVNENTSIIYIMSGLLLTGIGISLFISPNSNMIYGAVSNKDYAIASSMISMSRTFGQVIGMAILTVIINAVIGNIPIEKVAPGAITNTMHVSFLVFAMVCVAGIFFSLKRNK